MKNTIIFTVLLLSALLNSIQLEYTLKDDCEYFDKRSFSQRAFYLTTPSVQQLEEYKFINANSLIYSLEYGTNKLLLIKEIKENKETIKVFNQALNEFFTFDVEDRNKVNFKVPLVISFNPTDVQTSEEDIVLHLISITDDSIMMIRKDARFGAIMLDDKEYQLYLTCNDLNFFRSDIYCKYYIDFNLNGKQDYNSSIAESYNINDAFEFNGKTYEIRFVSFDGFNIEIAEAELTEKIGVGYLMPNFEYNNSDTKKAYNRINNKVTFIYWWDLGCFGSVQGIPAMNMIWDKYKDNNQFEFIAICQSKKERFETITNEISLGDDTVKIDFPTYTNNHEVQEIFGAANRVIIINAEGVIKHISGCNVVGKDLGKDDINFRKFDNIINDLLR